MGMIIVDMEFNQPAKNTIFLNINFHQLYLSKSVLNADGNTVKL